MMRGLTQAQLADLLDIDQAYISNWERGKHLPSLRYLEELEEVLDVPAETLLTRNVPPGWPGRHWPDR